MTERNHPAGPPPEDMQHLKPARAVSRAVIEETPSRAVAEPAIDILTRVLTEVTPRNLPALYQPPALPVPARLGGDVAVEAPAQRGVLPTDNAARAIVKGVCLVEQREWWGTFRRNPHNGRLYMESAAAIEPADPRAGPFKVTDLHLSGVACPVCARPVLASTCAYRPPLSCMPSACPGLCRQFTIEGG